MGWPAMGVHQLFDQRVGGVCNRGVEVGHRLAVPGQCRKPKRSELLLVRLFHAGSLHVCPCPRRFAGSHGLDFGQSVQAEKPIRLCCELW